MREPLRQLILWDIDHTLIETRGVGRSIYERAFRAATGRPLGHLATVAGRTELDIVADTLQTNDIEPTDERISELAAALVQGYGDAREELQTTGRALPGARDTLASLAHEPAVHQTVLTGNLRAIAALKLELFDLDQFLDLQSGAYGEDARVRAALVPVAQQRAHERTGAAFDGRATVLVGDTIKDVEAGLTAGVRVIGVATGDTSVHDLLAAGAHDAVTDLRAVARLVHGF